VRIRHIVWDWNGTLLDDTALTVRSARAALAAIGHPRQVSVADWRRIATRPLCIVYEQLVDGPLTSDQWQVVETVWARTYLDGLSGVGLNPTARAALAEAHARGITQSIVSLHTETELRAHVAALGMTDLFTHVTGSHGNWGGHRPSKAAEVRSQLADLDLPPSQALMIGDMEDDAREAGEAGTAVVLVPTGDTSEERLLASGYPVADSLIGAVRGTCASRDRYFASS